MNVLPSLNAKNIYAGTVIKHFVLPGRNNEIDLIKHVTAAGQTSKENKQPKKKLKIIGLICSHYWCRQD